jgi:hypothetical protein
MTINTSLRFYHQEPRGSDIYIVQNKQGALCLSADI